MIGKRVSFNYGTGEMFGVIRSEQANNPGWFWVLMPQRFAILITAMWITGLEEDT